MELKSPSASNSPFLGLSKARDGEKKSRGFFYWFYVCIKSAALNINSTCAARYKNAQKYGVLTGAIRILQGQRCIQDWSNGLSFCLSSLLYKYKGGLGGFCSSRCSGPGCCVGRAKDDEKHICPLQLGTIERCIKLYSNPGEVLLTPFMGIGSEAYQAIKFGRKAIGVELKESYYNIAIQNLANIQDKTHQNTLFDSAEVA
jgi:DNA modification methylase